MSVEEKIKIGVAVHTYGHIAPDVYANHLGMFCRWAKRYAALFIHVDGVKTAEARNLLVERAIEEGCTHIFFLDADHLVDENILPCLLGNTIATVVSGLIVKRDGKDSQVGFVKKSDGFYYNVALPTDGLSYAVDACAFGCTLIDLSVFKDIEKPYFKDVLYRDSEGALQQRRSDMEFCREVKALGKDIRIDTRVRVGHIGKQSVYYPKEVQYQLPVYKLAAELVKEMDNPSVVDFGCGSGRKLVEILAPLCQVAVGIDRKDLIEGCERLYPDSNIKWGAADLEEPIETCGKFDLVICADVLEHLDNPSVLTSTILDHLTDDGYAVISTPDVDTIPEGVKINPAHKQFWNEKQFVAFLSNNGLKIVDVKREKEISEYISIIAICGR